MRREKWLSPDPCLSLPLTSGQSPPTQRNASSRSHAGPQKDMPSPEHHMLPCAALLHAPVARARTSHYIFSYLPFGPIVRRSLARLGFGVLARGANLRSCTCAHFPARSAHAGRDSRCRSRSKIDSLWAWQALVTSRQYSSRHRLPLRPQTVAPAADNTGRLDGDSTLLARTHKEHTCGPFLAFAVRCQWQPGQLRRSAKRGTTSLAG